MQTEQQQGKRSQPEKAKIVAIVHVVFKSSSQAPPAAAHAEYIARQGRYGRRGGIELVESGNMPEFARADPHAFWAAADAHERANGRTYTEIQLALPRELDREQRHALAREAARELLGERFAYTLAVHTPLAKDNIEQPHMHLMFSERVVDEATRDIPEERFFKRNGAKKDPAWNAREKPEEVRVRWCALMNRALERTGEQQRVDPRSYAERGREDLASLIEPKLLGGAGAEAQERREEVESLRAARAALPVPALDGAAAEQAVERATERAVAAVERDRDRRLGLLDRLIERAKQAAAKFREQTLAHARKASERKRIEARIEALWTVSSGGQAARAATEKRDEDRRWAVRHQKDVERAEAALAQWKKENRLRAWIFDPVALRERLRESREAREAHRESSEATVHKLETLADEKKAAWPALLERAAEDTREIAVRLSPEQVKLLLDRHYGGDREASRAALAQLERRTQTLTTLDGAVTLRKFEREGFGGILQQMHKPLLDSILTQLAQVQERRLTRLEQAERERRQPRRERERDRGGWGD